MNEISIGNRVVASCDLYQNKQSIGWGGVSKKKKIKKGTLGRIEGVSGKKGKRIFNVRFEGLLIDGVKSDQIEPFSEMA